MIDIDRLQRWFLAHHRHLPFREDRSPYLVWISEIMLQQTQVNTVLPFFVKFRATYPDISSLAVADSETLSKLTEGLGYYRRFKLMKQAAEIIVKIHDGQFPETYEEILSLPGIGKYTAGAIMSIAYGKPYAATDGNVIRVIARHEGIEDDMRIEANRKRIDVQNQSWITHGDPRIYTEAMMELGALLCTPRQPACDQCPLHETCFAYQKGITDLLPVLSRKPAKQETRYVTLVLEDETDYVLRKRSERLLEGMYEWPQFEAESITSVQMLLEEQGIQIDVIETLAEVTHVFTHKIWKMAPYRAILRCGMHPEWHRVNKRELATKPMAVAHSKIGIK